MVSGRSLDLVILLANKCLLRGSVVEAQKIRVTITEAQALPLLTKISLYKTPTLSKKEAVQQLEFSEKSLAVTKGRKCPLYSEAHRI